MASRRLALIGCAEGPWVDISRVKRPLVRIRGLKIGILQAIFHDSTVMSFDKDGDYNLGACKWIRFLASTKQKSLVVEVLSAKVA